MDTKRKNYLLRKSDTDHKKEVLTNGHPGTKKDCYGFSSSKTYDLQTQTITLDAEDEDRKFPRGGCSCTPRGAPDLVVQKTSNIAMDKDLEFYPVDDHHSPSTFTAWDAFMAGNQAFFREPCEFPEAAFSYMDVIPEEDDVALLESDTDDTGSSVSTVIDRFSRTSTANSSFSERSVAKCELPSLDFDLEKVLGPFERLEKELDEEEPKTLSNGLSYAKQEIESTYPIVVITTSSSCEDVANIEEDADLLASQKNSDDSSKSVLEKSPISSSEGTSRQSDSVSVLNHKPNNVVSISVQSPDIAQSKTSDNASPSTPTRSKMANGHKIPEKPKSKKPKTRPTSPPPVAPRKGEPFAAPNVPPRLSKHLLARRTRSDPGVLEQQPSRIPRPIAASRSFEKTTSASKSPAKTNRSPKMGIPKKLKITDSPKKEKVSRGPQTEVIHKESIEINRMTEIINQQGHKEDKLDLQLVTENYPPKFDESHSGYLNNGESQPDVIMSSISHVNHTNAHDNKTLLHENENSDGKDIISDNERCNDGIESVAKSSVIENSSERVISKKNPFRSSDTNPFKVNSSSNRNPFQTSDLQSRNNPFEGACQEEKPVLHPKGQIAAPALLMTEAPPIPQRLSLSSTQSTHQKDRPVLQDDKQDSCDSIEPRSQSMELETSSLAEENPQSDSITETFKNTDEEMVKNEQKLAEQLTDDQSEIERRRDALTQRIFEQTESLVKSLLVGREERNLSNGGKMKSLIEDQKVPCAEKSSSNDPVRPIEDILEALDHLVQQPPREVEITMEWGPTTPTNIRETEVSGSSEASGHPGSPEGQTDVLPEDRRRSIENLLKEVDDCLRMHNMSESPDTGSELSPEVGPGTTDVPTAGSTPLRHEPRHNVAIVDTEDHPSTEMLKHLQNLDLRSDFYQHDNGQTAIHPRHSSGCDDSGVFLEDAIASSPETKLRSSGPNMRQFSVHDDSDAERSDDLGLASSSIDSADDLDGDPLPSTLKIEPPVISDTRQKPPPIPARKPYSKTYCNELTTELLLPKRPLLDKTSSLESNGSDSKSNEVRYNVEKTITLKNAPRSPLLSQQKHIDGFVSRSFEEENRSNHDSKSNFLARTLNPSSYLKPEQPSNLKWKSEECLRTAAEVKWSLSGRRNEKSVSVKDRIAMFSEMEANQSSLKKDDASSLHRYGSENNIKGIPTIPDRKNENETNLKSNGFGVDTKWHSMQSITPSRKNSLVEKDVSPSHILPSLNTPPTVPSPITDNINGTVNCCTLPLKLDVEPPKPIVSTYPETQLTNNKRYNYGLYSLKNLKNTEDLLSKKISGNGLLSIIENRKQPLPKLKGLVIPEKLPLANHSKALPTIVTTKSDGDPLKDYRRCSLPATIVTTCNTISRSKLEERERLKQNALAEPPWKSNGSSSNTLPKYSPAFKRRTLELPGSSLSPTPPSSITSPLSPPPSSPSSICSSNASSSLQQNVFQFSLSHSKPVTPLLPEKAVMSPPSLPSDVEYEGDNSEDSSTSASPMLRENVSKENSKLPPQNNGILHYERSNTFTSNARSVSLQPMIVESLAKATDKSPALTKETNGNSIEHPRSEVYLSKAEILLKKDDRPRIDLPPKTPSCAPVDYFVMRNHTASYMLAQNGKPEDLPGGKFRAQPIETPTKSSQNGDEQQWRRPCDDSEDEDDSHSTLSHRTEDSRHTTTDECLSDATTDSFDKPVRMVKNLDGYLSDATNESVDVSLARYQTRGSAEECLSDATTDSADWCPRAKMGAAKDHGAQRCSDDGLSDNSLDPDLRPRRLSQQRTVLKAQLEPSGSVQKFKALAEKWEHRTDVTSPTPPPTQPPPIPAKRDARSNSIAAVILSTSTNLAKSNQNALPPSLMPRNSVSEKKGSASPPSRPPPRESRSNVLQNGLSDLTNRITKTERTLCRNGFLEDEICGLSRIENSEICRTDSSSSGSSKTTLKDEEDFRPMKPMMRPDRESFDGASSKGLSKERHRETSLNNSLSRSQTDISKTFSLKKGHSMSVSDLLRSFENQTGGKDEKPPQQKKLSITEAPVTTTASAEYNHRPAKSSECTLPADEMIRLMETARIELADDKMEVVVVVLRREGGGGGSVGLTLAGGADYEVKEITVHKVIGGGLADRDGHISKGDRVLSINGHSLKGVSHGEALRILKAPSSRVVLTLAREKQTKDAQPKRQVSDRNPLQGTDGILQIELQKDGAGLGFSIEGGKDSPQGDRPLLIKRIFKGGVTDKSGQLDEGDELLSAQGQSFANMTRTEAWNYLKKLPHGPVLLKARKANS